MIAGTRRAIRACPACHGDLRALDDARAPLLGGWRSTTTLDAGTGRTVAREVAELTTGF